MRLQDALQRRAEVLEVLRLAEVRGVPGVLELDSVAAIQVLDQLRQRGAVLDGDLRGGGRCKKE